MVQPLTQTHAAKQLFGRRAHRLRWPAADHPGHEHVLERAELGQQVVELEDEADVGVAVTGQCRLGQAGEFPLTEEQGP